MNFAIKVEIRNPNAKSFEFSMQKTMYGGKRITTGDTIYIFASENEGGQGLIARGIVTAAEAAPKSPALERHTPRVNITVRRTARAKRPLGRNDVRHLTDWKDGRPDTEINFKFYRQATNKIVGLTEEASSFLATFF